MGDDYQRYTREELEEVALLAAGVGSGVLMSMHPNTVLPTQEVVEGVEAMLKDFDERRAAALGLFERLSGARREPVVGRVADGEEFPHG